MDISIHNIGIIDLKALLFRYSFGIKNFIINNQNIGGIFGILHVIKKYSKKYKIKKFFLCMEGQNNFKKKIFKKYKNNRPITPDFIIYQIKIIQLILKYISFVFVKRNNLEADDTIGTLSFFINNKFVNKKIYIFTIDKDLLQLVNKKTYVFLTNKQKLFDTNQKVMDFMGVIPKQIPDFLALTGDKVDNFYGIRGVGPKTAINLINKFSNIENLIANLPKINIKYRKLIQCNIKNLLIFKQLAKIVTTYSDQQEKNYYKIINKYIINKNKINISKFVYFIKKYNLYNYYKNIYNYFIQ